MARCARYRDQALAATRSLSVSIFKPEARTLPLTPHAQSGGCGASRPGWVCRLKAWRASSSRRATVFARRPCAVGPKLEERTGPPPHSALRRGPRPHYARPVSATRQRPLSVLVLVPGTPPHGRLVSRLVLRSAPQIWSAAIVGGKDPPNPVESCVSAIHNRECSPLLLSEQVVVLQMQAREPHKTWHWE